MLTLIRTAVDSRRHRRERRARIRDAEQLAAQARLEYAAHEAALTRHAAVPAVGEPVIRPVLSSARIEALQGTVRIHGQNPRDTRRCAAPGCRDRYPCAYRRGAEAELLAAQIEPWASR